LGGEDDDGVVVHGRRGDASNDEVEAEAEAAPRRLEASRLVHDRLTGSDPSPS
jgi:hypothetical protein